MFLVALVFGPEGLLHVYVYIYMLYIIVQDSTVQYIILYYITVSLVCCSMLLLAQGVCECALVLALVSVVCF